MNIRKTKQSTKNIIAFVLGGLFVFTFTMASTTIETNLDSAIQYIQKIVFTNNGGDTGTTGVIIDGTAGSIKLIDGVAVNNIKTTMTTTDNTSLATTEAISGFVNSAVAGYSLDNFYTTGVDFNTSDGTLSILVTGASNPSVDLDGRYLTSYSETDPVFVAHPAHGISSADISRRNSFDSSAEINAVESDPIYSASDAATITSTKITNRDTAYNRGDHSAAGYLTTETDPVFLAHSGDYYTTGESDSRYLRQGEGSMWNTGTTNSINYTDGNVGIGTDTPENTLNIAGILQIGSNSDDHFLRLTSDDIRFNSEHSSYIQQKGTGGNIIFKMTNNNGNLNSNMIINGSGNVGIGTTTPTEKLTVKGGNIQIQNTSSVGLKLYTNSETQRNIGTISFLANNQEGSVELAKIHTEYTDNSNDEGDLVFSTSSQGLGESMRIKGDGRVGIGTSTPTTKLQVNGSLKIHYDTTTCDSNKAGTIFFDNSHFYGCDGVGSKVRLD